MLLRSWLLLSDAEVMPNLPQGAVPLNIQSDTWVAPTHCCSGGGDVLGSEGHEAGGPGCASLGCAPLQHKACLSVTGHQQDKVPKPVESVVEPIQGGDVWISKSAGWGPKEMEPFCGEEEKQILVSLQGAEQPHVLHWAQLSPPGCCKVWLMRGVHVWLCHPLSTLAQSPRDSPGVGGM